MLDIQIFLTAALVSCISGYLAIGHWIFGLLWLASTITVIVGILQFIWVVLA